MATTLIEMTVTITDLTEHCLSSQTIASGNMLTVKCDQVRLPNGNASQREYVTHPGAVVVVPILSNGHVVLEKQFRYPLHQVFIELPAGKIDAGEAILATGQRELFEETGYSASDWFRLGHQHPCIGYSNEVIHMYLATGLSAGEHKRDEDESLEVFDASFEDCLSMIQNGQITDGKTIIALFMAEKYLALHQAPPI
jgi:ADP-ribose pyrophosphatase